MERFRSSARQALLRGVLCGALALAACGGGGSGGGGDATAPQSTVLAADAGIYLPASSPTKHFRGTDTRVPTTWPAEGYANTETWTGSGGERTLNETNALNANGGISENIALQVAADGVHDRSGGWLVDDALILRSPVRQGEEYTVVDRTVDVPDADGDGKPESVKIAVSVRVAGNEAISVAAGSFSSALKVVTSATLRITGSSAGAQAPVSITSTDWYAASIGRVKTVLVDGSVEPGLRGNTVTEELAGYRDGARAFGFFAPAPLFAGRTLDYLKAPPAVDTDGSGYLVALSQGAWISNNSLEGGGPVIGTLVGTNGTPGSTFTLIDSALHGGLSPAVVGTGSGYLVVSGDRTRLVAQRVSSNGTLQDGRLGAVIYSAATGVYAPSMVRLGDRILLAWGENDNSGGAAPVRAMLLDATTGQPVTQPLTVAAPSGFAGYPRVATDGKAFLLVFSAWPDSHNFFLARAYSSTLHAVRIDAAGGLIDAQAVALSQAGTAHSVAELRFDGTDYVIAWADNRDHLQAAHGGVYPPQDSNTGTFMQDVFVTRVSPATGAVAAGLPATGSSTTSTAAYRDAPALAVTPNQFVEVHNVFESGTSAGVYFRWLDRPVSAAAARAVSDNLNAIDTLPTFSAPYDLYGLSLATGNAQSVLVTFIGSGLRAALILPRAQL